MARKSKTEISDNTTIVFEAPDEPEFEPIKEPLIEPAQKKADEENLAPVEVSAKTQEEYCAKDGLTPIYGRDKDGNITCALRRGAVNVMPLVKRNPDSAAEPTIAFGITKERALINAVEMHKAHIKELNKLGRGLDIKIDDVTAVLPKTESEVIQIESVVEKLLTALNDYIDNRIEISDKNSDSGLRNKLKALLEDEAE